MLKVCVETVKNLLVTQGSQRVRLYTIWSFVQTMKEFFSGILIEIHLSLRLFTMFYSTSEDSKSSLLFKFFTQFPQSLLLPMERMYK